MSHNDLINIESYFEDIYPSKPKEQPNILQCSVLWKSFSSPLSSDRFHKQDTVLLCPFLVRAGMSHRTMYNQHDFGLPPQYTIKNYTWGPQAQAVVRMQQEYTPCATFLCLHGLLKMSVGANLQLMKRVL